MADFESESDFLSHYNIHDFDVPLATVDISIFRLSQDKLEVLLVKRAQHPAKGSWALPGGFIDLQKDTSLEVTAYRKLKEKTGVEAPYLEQVMTCGNRSRDPRGWSLTVVYLALISRDDIQVVKDSSSEDIAWVSYPEILENYSLAFDHKQLLESCYQRLKSKVQYTSLPVNLLPESFTLTQLQKTFELILSKPIEKKSFRRRILEAGILEETGAMKTGHSRPAKLYRVKPEGVHHLFPRNIEGPR